MGVREARTDLSEKGQTPILWLPVVDKLRTLSELDPEAEGMSSL